MKTGDGTPGKSTPPAVPRRPLLAAAGLAPVLVGLAGDSVAQSAAAHEPSSGPPAKPLPTPVPTTEADWVDVVRALGRPGRIIRRTYHHTPFPRHDLHVVSRGVVVSPGLALGSHVSFARYDNGSTLMMGDLAVTGDEMPALTDALHAHGIAQTAIHKHLPAQAPDIWWTHVCAHGHDAAALAHGLRTALDSTGTPPPHRPRPSRPLELDIAGINAALGVTGTSSEDVHACVFVRRETIIEEGHILPPGLGATSAFNFQPLGGGRAALSGDLAMVAAEVQEAHAALRRGGIDLVELHNHGLTDEPRLFFTHIWAEGDAVALARAVRPALAATNVTPAAV
ncbi:DUF1259 domain-containing protein [Kitasatospora sp. NPDC093102]|uniref:DUF1259 domain-containing protein n=1 Tax=Kitasatospora sp. NPDC093102 TaxID=3155069 RepID=UPI00342691AB